MITGKSATLSRRCSPRRGRKKPGKNSNCGRAIPTRTAACGKVIAYQPGGTGQRTLVLIKPDNFRFPTGRPGNVIDFFSRAGLFIVGAKVHRMSVAQAMEFYGPVREVLRTKLKDMVGAKAKAALEKEFSFKIPAAEEKKLGETLCATFGDNQFENIIRFMSGHAPSELPKPTGPSRAGKVHRDGL